MSKVYRSNSRRLHGITLFDVLNVLLMIGLCIAMLYPVLYILGRSFMDDGEKALYPLRIIPRVVTTEAYDYLFYRSSFVRFGFVNSVVRTVVGTALNMLATIPMAYVLSKRDYPLRRIITILVTFTMWFSGGLIPNYLLVKSLGLVDTYWALWLPGLISAWNMLVLRNFFQEIPRELEESAWIDGAGEMTVMLRIILPLSTASIASISLFYAVGHWNAWFDSMIYLNDYNKLPLQNQLRNVLNSLSALNMESAGNAREIPSGQIPAAETLQYSCVIVTILPIIMVYPFLQKYFVKGVMSGSIKG